MRNRYMNRRRRYYTPCPKRPVKRMSLRAYIIIAAIGYISSRIHGTNWVVAMLIYAAIIVGAVYLFKRLVIHIIRLVQYGNASVDQIDLMNGEEFEQYLRTHFELMGYIVKDTPISHDYGADLVLWKKGVKIAVQAKRYTGNVGNGAVQEIVAALPEYKADRGMVVTNSHFTNAAINLANVNHVELWDREKMIHEFSKRHLPSLHLQKLDLSRLKALFDRFIKKKDKVSEDN